MQLQDCNVILVDYGSLSKCSYIYLAGIVVSDIGKYLAKCIKQWNLPLAQTQLIGFSLGAHICGVVGCTLDGNISKIIGKSSNINFDNKCVIKTVKISCSIGLDPAGPMFTSTSPSIKQNGLNASCAKFVEVIHTTNSFGMRERIGHSDFYANRNETQPGCSKYDEPCCHGRAKDLFYASCFNEYKFIGHPCDNSSDKARGSRFGYFNTNQTYGCFEFKTKACWGFAMD